MARAADERRYLRAVRRHADAAVFVAVDGEQIVGRLSVARDPHPASPHVADLGLFVAASHRRRGVGRLLLETAVAWARGVGIRKLELHVFPWNVPAIRLYEDFGFVREGLRRGHYLRDGADVDALLMAFTSLRDRNPLHLQRPDQESPHLGLVARVEQRLTADEASRGLHGGHELGDRRPRLRTTDRERDPAGSPVEEALRLPRSTRVPPTVVVTEAMVLHASTMPWNL